MPDNYKLIIKFMSKRKNADNILYKIIILYSKEKVVGKHKIYILYLYIIMCYIMAGYLISRTY